MKAQYMKKIIKDQYVEPKRYGSKGFSYLTLEKRRKLQKMLEGRTPLKEIAKELNMSRSTIYYERMRMGSLEVPYDAEEAQKHACNGGKINAKKRVHIPRSYQQNISKIYRLLNPLLENYSDKQLLETIEQCIILLERMGADPDKMKRPVTGFDIERIIDLHKQGRNLSEIERLTNRSRSTIHGILKKHKETIKTKTTGDITYEYLRKKWID